jgi:predicted permease
LSTFLGLFLDVIVPVFGIVVSGYLLGPRLGLESRTLTRVAYYVFVPAFVFQAIGSAQIALASAIKMVLLICLVQLLVAATAGAIAHLLGRSREMIAAYIIVASFINVGNYGLAIIQFRFGETSLPAATLVYIIVVIVQFIIGIGAADWARGEKGGIIGGLFRTPVIWAAIPALLLNAGSYSLPLMPTRMIALLAAAMIPVMLFTLGLQFAKQKRFHLSGDALIATSLRLLWAPALAMTLGGLFQLKGTAFSAAVMQMAMPTAVIATIVAAEKQIASDFVNTVVMLTTLVSLISLPLFMSIL